MTRWPFRLVLLGLVIVAVSSFVIHTLRPPVAWTAEEKAMLHSLWIGNLPNLPPDPSNAYADDPRAAILGQKLFFDTRFSGNGQVSCATCHLPELMFQDGIPLAQGIGTTNRRTMTLVGTAYSPWFFWDGRKDSQWTQALGPLENPVEHGGNRTQYAHLIAQYYRTEYEALFGPLPELLHLPANAGPLEDPVVRIAWEKMAAADQEAVTGIYANIGKSIAAYERLLVPGPGRFDRYVEAVLNSDTGAVRMLFTRDEAAGLKLFLGQGQCTQCHNGPLFTDNHFHNTGVPAVSALPQDTGRASGVPQALSDEFNCLSPYSDAESEECAELRYMITTGEPLMRAFKPPSLRNVVGRGPYMHAGQFSTLEEALAHYNSAPPAPAGRSEIKPLNLSQAEIAQLIAFLGTLTSPIAAEPRWLQDPLP